MIRSVILSAFALLVFAVQSPAATPLKIMPLGDSITNGGSGSGYRGPLYQKLTAANYSFQFVGSRTDNATAALTTSNNSRHEGHSGSFIKTGDATRIGIYDYLPTWINAAQPDIILLHIGTNDAAAYRDPATMKSDLDAVLTRIHGLRPSADVLVAQIIPIRNDYYGTNAYGKTLVPTYNANVADLVAAHKAKGERVSLVNQYSGFNTSTMFPSGDSIHPNAAGYEQMATVWSNAIQAVPEPTSLAVVGLVGAALVARRRPSRIGLVH